MTLAADERLTRGVYRFQFSSTSSLAGSAFCLTFLILVIFASLMGLPAVLKYEASVTPSHALDRYSQYGWLTYLLVLNGLLLLLGGRCIVSVISYPYSSRLFRRNLARTTNEKFGEEFKRCVNRMVDIVEQISS